MRQPSKSVGNESRQLWKTRLLWNGQLVQSANYRAKQLFVPEVKRPGAFSPQKHLGRMVESTNSADRVIHTFWAASEPRDLSPITQEYNTINIS